MVGLSVVQLAAAKGVKTINIIRRRFVSDVLKKQLDARFAFFFFFFHPCVRDGFSFSFPPYLRLFFRSDYDELVERMKSYGAYMVVGDDYIRTREFRQLISDLPKPKLALNCVGGESSTEMARLLGYVQK